MNHGPQVRVSVKIMVKLRLGHIHSDLRSVSQWSSVRTGLNNCSSKMQTADHTNGKTRIAKCRQKCGQPVECIFDISKIYRPLKQYELKLGLPTSVSKNRRDDGTRRSIPPGSYIVVLMTRRGRRRVDGTA